MVRFIQRSFLTENLSNLAKLFFINAKLVQNFVLVISPNIISVNKMQSLRSPNVSVFIKRAAS